MINYIILGIVQGITEFLPISSSGHLALFEHLFHIQEKLELTVFLHFGSVLAIIIAMRQEIKNIIKNDVKKIALLIVASIPAGIFGFLLKDILEKTFNSPYFIGITLFITGIILWLVKYTKSKRNDINFLSAIIIGIGQAIAIFPGISRSGATISTGMFLGIDKIESAKFSFLLAIISIIGANIFELRDIASSNIPLSILGILVSFIISYLAIVLLLKIIRIKKFYLFSLYCWFLSLLIFLLVC